ncbi:MAG: phenylalanyl-tRNA synthetase beta subunit [Acidimicrobiaceae bacterium]|nr:phenylalanyl-tRNA synthetase beta subunit [Acidimicrobiaceae bacterium]
MRIALSWLREFVELSESVDELTTILDDLGLVVEGVEVVGEGLDDVVVARIDDIRAITGADRVRLVTVDAGHGPLDIVCGATNFEVGNYVPLAPVGAVLPGGFTIAERTMRGVTSHGMLCSSRELRLSDDHEGLMILDSLVSPRVGEGLLSALAITPDTVFDISVEGNRPDAWSVEGVARDLATRLERPLKRAALATTSSTTTTASFGAAAIDAPDLCGRLTVSVFRNVTVAPSPSWVAQRLMNAGMRPISNVVDASNYVMLELGQPTGLYDAALVAKHTLRARRARSAETLTTLDGVTRELARAGRGLGDTGEDCVIVDGDDQILGLAGIMGGASSEISPATTDVLLEAAYFDPMTIARSSKRHALRSEASNRFERGVDPQLALRAAARYAEVLGASVPELEWLSEPLDVLGELPLPPTITVREEDVQRLLGVEIPGGDITSLLRGLEFEVSEALEGFTVTAPTRRLDIREGIAGRADVIEEIARLYGYGRIARRTPSWPEFGALSERQTFRRHVRDVVVDLGAIEAWTPSLGSDADFDLLHPGQARVRITNPFSAEESVLRATMITGLVRAWSKNVERGVGDVILAEFGVVFQHPSLVSEPRRARGGAGGTLMLELPSENERLTVVFGRVDDDATSAVAAWRVLSRRLGLDDVVVRTTNEAPPGLHPTRAAALVDRASGALLGYVGEIDGDVVRAIMSGPPPRRVGLLDLDLDALGDPAKATRAPEALRVPSRYPSAIIDLAFVTPREVNAGDLAHALKGVGDLVESISLFDVYEGPPLDEGTRSLAYTVRLSSNERTLGDDEISRSRKELISMAASLGATLR